MDDSWLKALGMGARGQQIPDDWASLGNGLFRNAVTFARRPGIKSGDGIVLYASGTGLFFAIGNATSYPYLFDEGGSTSWPWRVNVRLDHWRDFVHDGVSLDVLNVNGRNLRVSIKRRSHIRLSALEHQAAASALGRSE